MTPPDRTIEPSWPYPAPVMKGPVIARIDSTAAVSPGAGVSTQAASGDRSVRNAGTLTGRPAGDGVLVSGALTPPEPHDHVIRRLLRPRPGAVASPGGGRARGHGAFLGPCGRGFESRTYPQRSAMGPSAGRARCAGSTLIALRGGSARSALGHRLAGCQHKLGSTDTHARFVCGRRHLQLRRCACADVLPQ